MFKPYQVTMLPFLCVIGGCAGLQPSAPLVQLPDKLKAGAHESVAMVVPASGVQIYQCRPSKDDAARYEWTHLVADAELFAEGGHSIGRHFGGPYWESTDGSRIVGTLKERAAAPAPGAVPWLLLTAKSVGSEGSFSKVTSIQRVNTVGGAPPKTGCSRAEAGSAARVAFTAQYYFFTAK